MQRDLRFLNANQRYLPVKHRRLKQRSQHPSGTYEGEGYVIMRHPDTAVVERALRRVVEVARVELAEA